MKGTDPRILRAMARMHEDELEVRRYWAEYIREEFGKHHDHSGGGECGACGAIQAARWMDPYYEADGPKMETYETWKDRQP